MIPRQTNAVSVKYNQKRNCVALEAGILKSKNCGARKQSTGRAGKKKRRSTLYDRQKVIMVRKITREIGTSQIKRVGVLRRPSAIIPEMRYRRNGSNQMVVRPPEYHPGDFGSIFPNGTVA